MENKKRTKKEEVAAARGRIRQEKERPLSLVGEEEGASDTFPWLNGDGTVKSDEEIRRLGKDWSAETWDLYLRADVGTLDDDALCFFADMDTEFVLERHRVLDILKNREDYGGIRFALLLALDELSFMEKTVVEYSFWKGMEDRDIAEALGTTYGAVRVHKSHAVKKLGRILPSKRLKVKLGGYGKTGCSKASYL